MTEGFDYHAVVDRAREQRGYVLVEKSGAIARVTLNEPQRLNPLSAELSVELLDRLQEVNADEEIRAIILTGTDPAFCAGGDVRAMREVAHRLCDESEQGATDMWRWVRNLFGGVVRLIAHSDKLFIAAINGPAAGVGLSFALACDLRIASDRARLLFAVGQIGLIPEVGTSWLLTRRLGYAKTLELFISGEPIPLPDAAAMGLINEVVPHDELDSRACTWAERALAMPRYSLAMTKASLRQAIDGTWEQVLTMEEFAIPQCFTARAQREAVEEFMSKGRPR